MDFVDRFRVREKALRYMLDDEIARRYLDRLLVGGNCSRYQSRPARIAVVKIVHLTTAGSHLRVNVKNLEQCAHSRFAHADYKRCRVSFSSFALLAHHSLQLSLQSEMLGSKENLGMFCGCLRAKIWNCLPSELTLSDGNFKHQ